MKTSDFYYDLPEELIAQDPLEDRSASRLLVLDKKTGEMEHRHFRDILHYLKKGDCLVINDTKVIPARLMGHKVGSLTLNAGVAGGADVILIPEIPYDINKVAEAIQKRNKAGKRFTILAVAEGAISKEDAELPKKKYKEKLAERAKKYPSVSYEIADQIQKVTGSEVRITVPGHMQRGGEPCAYDRVLSTRIGAGAAQAIMDEEYGVMIGVINGKIKRVPLAECAGKLKMVSPKDQLVKAAKQIGISFGD